MYNTACPPHHPHDGFMVTGILGDNNLQLHVAGIQESKEYILK